MAIVNLLFVMAVGVVLAAATERGAEAGEASASDSPDFAAEVRPILSNHCYACHGPDEADRQAGLRLDTADGIAGIVDVESIDDSELLVRIHAEDPDVIMPPPSMHKPLSEGAKEVLRRWIAAGAPVEQHWAFVPPVPLVLDSGEPDIDYFIDGRLSEVGLTANGPQDDRSLMRRVCLDLTGLPPSREQIEAFAADEDPDRYERFVDELLVSPEFGKHVGRHWLDLVRYADTHGLHLDNYREMWLYRDWVIDAVNANMPFDEFITKQLAGDLLPDATTEDLIASGFNRLNVTTNEGGSIYDEVFARNCIDRTDAFGTIFLALTTQCAVCHDHKFDPISQRDYYSLLGYFNSLDGRAMDGNQEDPPPTLSVPSPEQTQRLDALHTTVERLVSEMEGDLEEVDQAESEFLEIFGRGEPLRTEELMPSRVVADSGREMDVLTGGEIRGIGEPAAKDIVTVSATLPAAVAWKTLRLDVLAGDEERVGESSNGNAVLTEFQIERRVDSGRGEASSPQTDLEKLWKTVPIVSATADIEQSGDGFAIAKAIDGNLDAGQGWALAGHQQLGPRTAWFTFDPIVGDGPMEIRVRLSFQSQYPAHQFKRFRLVASTGGAEVPNESMVKIDAAEILSPVAVAKAADPLDAAKAPVDVAAERGKELDVAPEGGGSSSVRWELDPNVGAVRIVRLPKDADGPRLHMIRQVLRSPKKQTVELMYGVQGGVQITLNDQEVAKAGLGTALDPLARKASLDLREGENRLVFRVASSQDASAAVCWAYASRSVEVPPVVARWNEVPRSEEDQLAMRRYYRQTYCDAGQWLMLQSEHQATTKAIEKLRGEIPTTLIWKELTEPRVARVLNRGQYDQPGDEVPRATPGFLPPMPEGVDNDRLGLAKWLTDPNHPLTARVAVNRFWQMIFGAGLVRTSEDFGNQGEPPSHPLLLDHLAHAFVAGGWDVKKLLRDFVTSDVYRRSPKVTEEMLRLDPGNRFFARGPRHRLDAEVLRDQALSLAGLLVDRDGGPSVKPPQPGGLWHAVGYTDSNTANFVADQGDKVYRRSVYTFWKRTSAPPQMATFDAPTRESCTARRERTNTPLQALLLMNETQYLEAARGLADRALQRSSAAVGANEDLERIAWMFETATASLPSDEQLEEMAGLVGHLRQYYGEHPDLAESLTDSTNANVAAYTLLASTLLNLDRVVSK